MEAKIVEEIKRNKAFLIASHINPEGDAIGSALALAISLKNIGKEVTVFNQDPIPRNLQFLPMSAEIIHEIDGSLSFDAAFVLDCGGLDRVGKEIEKIRKIINIDHHITNSRFGDIRLVDSQSSSTAELIYAVLKDIPIEVTYEIALNIYTAILTDTGAFCNSNTTEGTFHIASEMVRIGVNPSSVAEKIYQEMPVSRLKLLGLVLNTLEILGNGRIASVVATLSMLKKTGATPELTEDIVTYPRSILGVKVAVLFREVSKNYYKVSFRSNKDVDVADIAREFSGGGHPNASGGNVGGSLLEVKGKVFEAISRRLV
ncbi:MAG: DHH family phosphoesterase [Deltaproteobacteria bacterium CG_4_9_14_3_um_filter_44_9]|nr:MAG: DHH family phosphoesterase [Deltaproteobacteria bacterium CG_4_9_14_3_um_filter_44_9]